MAKEIKSIIHYAAAKNLRLNFCWFHGHVGIVGNEMTDAAAKEAAMNENNPTLGGVISTYQRQIREAARNDGKAIGFI